MGKKAKNLSKLGAYDAAHAVLRSLGVDGYAGEHEMMIEVVAECMYGGSVEAAVDAMAVRNGRSAYWVWEQLRDCLDDSGIDCGVEKFVRKAVQTGLDGPCSDRQSEQPVGSLGDSLAEVQELREELRRILAEGEYDD